MQRPAFSQSPKRVGSGPSRPPISLGAAVPVSVAVEASAPGLSASGRESGREFVSGMEPDDDGGGPFERPVVCQKPPRPGTVRFSFVTRLDFGFHECLSLFPPRPALASTRAP